MKIYETISSEETYRIAKELSSQAKPGQIFILNGEMGVGKTVFAKGFARGLGITEHITSPTFTILNIYQGNLPLYHFDLYRLGNDIYDQGFEEYFFGQGVCLIEWGKPVIELIKTGYTLVYLTKDIEKGLDYRYISIQEKEKE